MYSHPSAPIQILTVDTRKPCGFLCRRLHDDGRPLQRKSRIERRFESSPESRGSQTSGVLLVLFVQAKRINSFSLQRTSRFRKPRFSPPQWRLRTNKIKSFPKGGFEVLQTSNQRTQTKLRTMLIISFCRSAAFQGGIAAKRVPCRERFHTFC